MPKFVLRTLRADMNVEVTSIFYINPDKTFAVVEKLSEDQAAQKTVLQGLQMPRTREELRKYDCVFLGKDIDEVFTSGELKLLQEYVSEDGGSVVFFRGKPYERGRSELAKLEPVRWGDKALADARFELTEEGKTNPIFDYGSRGKASDRIIRELPAMTSITRVTDEKSLAVVLARIEGGRRNEQIATLAKDLRLKYDDIISQMDQLVAAQEQLARETETLKDNLAQADGAPVPKALQDKLKDLEQRQEELAKKALEALGAQTRETKDKIRQANGEIEKVIKLMADM